MPFPFQLCFLMRSFDLGAPRFISHLLKRQRILYVPNIAGLGLLQSDHPPVALAHQFRSQPAKGRKHIVLCDDIILLWWRLQNNNGDKKDQRPILPNGRTKPFIVFALAKANDALMRGRQRTLTFDSPTSPEIAPAGDLMSIKFKVTDQQNSRNAADRRPLARFVRAARHVEREW